MATQTRYASKDAHMGKNIGGTFSGWNGQDNHLIVGATSDFKWRSVVAFNIDFSPMLAIESATLYLYNATSGTIHANQTSAPSTLKVARMTSDWGEGSTDPGEGNLTSTLSWDWDNRFDKYTNTGNNTKSITQGSDGSTETIDVTDIVTAWFNGSNNYGFILINDSSETSASKGMQFYAREKGGDYRPKLVITYTTNTPPNAPSLTSPIDMAIINSLVPTLSGTRSDPDSGDYITAAQVEVYQPSYNRFQYSTTLTAGDPGTGKVRFNTNFVTGEPTAMYISETDYDAISMAAAMGSWNAMNIRVTNMSTGENGSFIITSIVDNGTYRTVGLAENGLVEMGVTPANNAILAIEIALNTEIVSNSTLMWSSGSITISGSPTTFSIVYGSVGTATALVGNQYYKWRAKTRDKGSEWSTGWSEWGWFKTNTAPNSPTVALVTTPSTAVPDDTPDFNITHSDNDANDTKMYAYQFQIDKESSAGSGSWTTEWDSGVADQSASPVTTKTVTAPSLADIVSGDSKWGGSFRYRAKTQDRNGAWSPYSAYQYFTLKSTGVPINLDPTANAATSLTPDFSGDRASTADTIVAFTLEVRTGDLVTTKLAATRYTTGIDAGGSGFSKAYAGSTLTSGTQYAWRVKVEGSTGGVSNWSSWQYFTPADATVPTRIAPTGTGNTLTPTVTFDRVATFNRIQYEVYPSTSTDSNLGTAHYASGTISANIAAGGLGTRYSAAYAGTALVYSTTYKIRARVSSDAGANWSSWSGLASFSTDTAGQPTVYSMGGGGVLVTTGTTWIADTTPDFVIDGSGTEIIDYAQVQVWNESHSGSALWDSGLIDVTESGGRATVPWSGTSTLTPGTTYSVRAKYTKSTGPTGTYSDWYTFRVNAAPGTPNNLYPTNGTVLANTLLPEFRATFTDADTSVMGDSPTEMVITTQSWNGSAWVAHGTKTISSGLLVGENSYQWQAGDTAFAYDTRYRFKVSFKDQKSAAGLDSSWSEWTMSTAPNGTITTPTTGSTINTVRPTISWSYSGGTQYGYTIKIEQTDPSGVVMDNGFKATIGPRVSAVAEYEIQNSGYFQQSKYYNITLTVKNTAGLDDPTPSTVNVQVQLDAPDAIQNLSSETSSQAYIGLDWTKHTLATGHSFVAYKIYRRIKGDVEWQHIDNVLSINNSSYRDYYAGNELAYDYKVNVAVNKGGVGVELESPDEEGESITYGAELEIDRWMFIGYDRADEHIQELTVVDENHNAVIQQEQFETLGSDRKVIIRGFVLGVEGTITCIWRNEEIPSPADEQVMYNATLIGRRLLAYLITNRGPHILKSPFGDVWDVQFEGPEYRWLPGGHLEVTLNYIETGRTGDVEI